MREEQHMKLEFESRSVNEGFVRTAVAAFLLRMNPTVEEMEDVKTAVSEAVTNSIIHGYENEVHTICLQADILEDYVTITVEDHGRGIPDIEKAMEPLYTTKPELERSGMGCSFMEAFMDELHVTSSVGNGTTVRMKKKIGKTVRTRSDLTVDGNSNRMD